MKRSTITSIALLAALVGSLAASAASYDYTPTIATSASPRFPDAWLDAQLQAATVTCDDAVGVQRAKP